jgi:multidrug efflux system membrane fusion protein
MVTHAKGAVAGRWRVPAAAVVLAGLGLTLVSKLPAALQDSDEPARAGEGEQEVIIKREALRVTDPRAYQVNLRLEAARAVELIAPIDGIVRTVQAAPGQKCQKQAEVVRFDDARMQLVVKRAKANLHAAQIEKRLQPSGDADRAALAEARLDAATSELELAQYDVDQLVVRAPFHGECERVYVSEGQFVRAGERLARIVDPAKLKVEVPAERSQAAVGGTLEIRVEQTPVKAKVDAVLPLAEEFDAVRELAQSPVSALVSIENAAGKFSAGQTVYCDLIPQDPVALVPAAAVSNLPDGRRKVQVLRDSVIRNLSVRVMSVNGTESVFVAGRFGPADEVIVSSTRELMDGTPLRALAAATAAASKGATSPRSAGGKAGSTKKQSNTGAAF